MAIRIRKYLANDKASCIEMFTRNIGSSFEPEELPLFENWLENHDEYPFFVAELDGKPVACGGIYFDDRYDRAGLSWSMVDPDYQRKGIGRELTQFCMREIESAFPGNGCFIETIGDSTQFYIKMGFGVVEVKKGPGNSGNRYLLEFPSS